MNDIMFLFFRGEMVVSLINDRPNIKNFSYSDTLQQWTRATNVRLRLLRPMTLHSHSIIHDSQDKSVTRRYFYSIRDIGIGGHCQCNGMLIEMKNCFFFRNTEILFRSC